MRFFFYPNPMLFSCHKYSFKLENLNESFTATPAIILRTSKQSKMEEKLQLILNYFFKKLVDHLTKDIINAMMDKIKVLYLLTTFFTHVSTFANHNLRHFITK